MPGAFLSLGFKDVSEEPGSLRFPTEATPGAGEISALITAASAMSSMRLMEYTTGLRVIQSSAPGLGQRELKWLIRVHDSVNQQKFSLSLPGGALGLATMISGTDFADMTAGAALALKNAIEACVTTPWYDNLVVVDSMELTRGQK